MTRVPFNYTWIEQGKLMAGSIPTSQDDIALLRSMGISSIVSLTRRNIADEFNLGIIKHKQYAIPDNGVPEDDKTAFQAADFIDYAYQDYPAVYVHCRGG